MIALTLTCAQRARIAKEIAEFAERVDTAAWTARRMADKPLTDDRAVAALAAAVRGIYWEMAPLMSVVRSERDRAQAALRSENLRKRVTKKRTRAKKA